MRRSADAAPSGLLSADADATSGNATGVDAELELASRRCRGLGTA